MCGNFKTCGICKTCVTEVSTPFFENVRALFSPDLFNMSLQ